MGKRLHEDWPERTNELGVRLPTGLLPLVTDDRELSPSLVKASSSVAAKP